MKKPTPIDERVVEIADKPKVNGKLPPCSIDDVHKVFRKHMGGTYDLDVIDVVCAAAAAERLSGDPAWLLVIGGPGVAKTETIQTLIGAGAHVTSTISSDGALLSASPKKSVTKTATGGLLRKIGERGLLVIKDVTSILSAARETRGGVLAALREVYDGRWERNVGTDGGQTLTWVGRIVVIGAVTTAWDAAHAVVAAMGDRFVLIRMCSDEGRMEAGTQALRNTGSEVAMREELATVVGGLILHTNTDDVSLTDEENEQLLKAANITTMARTAVERDFKGEVLYPHAKEMPTRFAKQLAQIVRGGIAIGLSRERGMELAIRCAKDSIPPMRLEILLDLAVSPVASTPAEVRSRTGKPWSSTKRELEALTMLRLVECKEEEIEEAVGATTAKTTKTKWTYELNAAFDHKTLLAMAGQQYATLQAMAGPPRGEKAPSRGVRF